MNPVLEGTILESSPFVDAKGAVDVKGLSSLLQFDQATMAKTLGVSRQAVSQQLAKKEKFVRPRSQSTQRFLFELNQVLALLRALTDPATSTAEMRRWLHSPNKALGLKRPVDLIKQRKLAPLKEALMDALTAAQGA